MSKTSSSPTAKGVVDLGEYLQKRTEQFQKEFDLTDWSISINQVLKPERENALMEVHFTPEEKIASIRVNKDLLFPLNLAKIDYCITHELVHLLVDPIVGDDKGELEIERVVDQVSILISRGR